MKVFIVHAYAEPGGFNGALFQTAQDTLRAAILLFSLRFAETGNRVVKREIIMTVLDALTRRFGTQTAVDALSFEIPAGQIVGFLGPNGAGKSTALKMLIGMIEPSGGRATVCGFDL